MSKRKIFNNPEKGSYVVVVWDACDRVTKDMGIAEIGLLWTRIMDACHRGDEAFLEPIEFLATEDDVKNRDEGFSVSDEVH
jgi:hypothetical protein